MARLNGLGLANEVENSSMLFNKLEAAKEKAALREFDVTITETLQKTVTITAKDQCEAELIVQDEWDNQEHIIDAEHFKGVTFTAAPVIPDRARSGEER
jgi:hypothetical protein